MAGRWPSCSPRIIPRIERLLLCNAEAYDDCRRADERPLVCLTKLPLLGPAVLQAAATRRVYRPLLSLAHAVKNTRVLDDELIGLFLRANASDPQKRAKTARFLAGPLDPANTRCTVDMHGTSTSTGGSSHCTTRTDSAARTHRRELRLSASPVAMSGRGHPDAPGHRSLRKDLA